MRASDVFPAGQDGLSANLDPGRGCHVFEKFGNPFLPGQVRAVFKKGRVDAWASDKFSKQVLD